MEELPCFSELVWCGWPDGTRTTMVILAKDLDRKQCLCTWETTNGVLHEMWISASWLSKYNPYEATN